MRPCDADTEDKWRKLKQYFHSERSGSFLAVQGKLVKIKGQLSTEIIYLSHSDFKNMCKWYMTDQSEPEPKIDGHFRTVITPGKGGEG